MKRLAHDADLKGIVVIRSPSPQLVPFKLHRFGKQRPLQGKRLEAHLAEHTVTLYHAGKVVAQHSRSHRKGQHSSLPAHHHHAMLEWSPERLLSWAASIGPYTAHWVDGFIRQAAPPAQAVRPCQALLGQSKTYGKARLEAACLRGYLTGANRLHHIRNMLKHGLEQQPVTTARQDPLQDIHHDNVHGEHYFH